MAATTCRCVLLSCALLLGAFSLPAAAQTSTVVRGGMEHLSGDRTAWRELFAEVRHQDQQRRQSFVAVTAVDRFDRQDVELSGGGALPIGGSWTIDGSAAAAPGSWLLPRGSVEGGLSAGWSNGWGARLGASQRWYRDDAVTVGSATVERYAGPYRVAYRLQVGEARHAGPVHGHLLQVGRYGGDRRTSATLVLGGGREAESVGDSLVTASTRSIAVWGAIPAAARWELLYEAGLHRQGELYTRTGWKFGVRKRW